MVSIVCSYCRIVPKQPFNLAALKNDDAEDSGDEGEGEGNETVAREKNLLELEKRSSEKQPTGRIVGVIKRNWRA
jgi:exosome complex exonuclease DIS3/RRP44